MLSVSRGADQDAAAEGAVKLVDGHRDRLALVCLVRATPALSDLAKPADPIVGLTARFILGPLNDKFARGRTAQIETLAGELGALRYEVDGLREDIANCIPRSGGCERVRSSIASSRVEAAT